MQIHVLVVFYANKYCFKNFKSFKFQILFYTTSSREQANEEPRSKGSLTLTAYALITHENVQLYMFNVCYVSNESETMEK